MRTFNLSANRVCVLPEAPSAVFSPRDCKSDAHRAALALYNLRPDERYLLYVGGISPHKNLGTLIEGFAQLVRAPGYQDVRLVLVGDYTGDVFRTCYMELRQQTVRLGIGVGVQFTGFVADEDLAHLYTAAQAFVFPSYLEGFGLPVVEAMTCGSAVVAGNYGSLPEVLNGAGHLFDPHNVAALVDGLQRVLADAQYRKTLQKSSLAQSRHFSWEQSAQRAVEIFYEMQR